MHEGSLYRIFGDGYAFIPGQLLEHPDMQLIKSYKEIADCKIRELIDTAASYDRVSSNIMVSELDRITLL